MPEEQRVGRLVVRRGEEAVPWIEIARARVDSTGSRASRVVFLLALLLALGLLTFALIVRSGPAVGTVSAALAALAWLLSSRRSREGAAVRIGAGELALAQGPRRVKVPVERIEEVGVGRDVDPLATVWARDRDRGRLLLLDGLSEEEARFAVRCMREALTTGAAQRG